MIDAERCPDCGALYALVGRVHLCRPRRDVVTPTVTKSAARVTEKRVTKKHVTKTRGVTVIPANKRDVKRIWEDGIALTSIVHPPGPPVKRGRPRKGEALSSAERVRRHRERARAKRIAEGVSAIPKP